MIRLSQLLLFINLLTATSLSTAQDSDNTNNNGKVAPSTSEITEITVVSEESLNNLRALIEEAEDEIYAFFNANNSSKKMDIVCSDRRPTGSNMLKRECEPRFLNDLRIMKTRESRIGAGIRFDQEDLVEWSKADFETLQKEMVGLMAQHKDFADRLAELSQLAATYAAQSKELFEEEQ
jgi:hypothetical protein